MLYVFTVFLLKWKTIASMSSYNTFTITKYTLSLGKWSLLVFEYADLMALRGLGAFLYFGRGWNAIG